MKNLPANAGAAWRGKFNPWVWKLPWRRKWQPIPVFLSENFHGQKNLAGYSPRGPKELDMTEQLCTEAHTTDEQIVLQINRLYYFVLDLKEMEI